MKEASHKRTNPVQAHLYEVPRGGILTETESRRVGPGVEEGTGGQGAVVQWMQMETPRGPAAQLHFNTAGMVKPRLPSLSH